MADARDIIRQFLASWGLSNMESFIEQALTEGWDIGGDEFTLRLRDTPEYKLAFPEQAFRQANGFTTMPESQILAQRDEIRRITREYLGLTLTGDEIARIIGRDKSLGEWEATLKDWKVYEQWGPLVKQTLEQELGRPISDDRVFAVLSSEIPTPELDRAMQNALYRAQPAQLGLGVRPEEEAEILRQFGIDTQQAFRGYQGIAEELPRAERLAFIEAEINRNADKFPPAGELFGDDTTFGTLFRAIQLGDADALATLRAQMARENARWQGGGGAARSQSGASVGLLGQSQK